ncbi:MAG TPA: restriction endonuclease subunit S [Ignavibacteria bacterium]
MNRYEKYKPSGIDWIGEIPSHWKLKKIKYLFQEHSGNGFPEDMQGRDGGDIPFFKVSDLNKSEINVETSNNYVSYEDVQEKRWNVIPENSILTAKIGEALRKNHRKISLVKCIIDNNCIALYPICLHPKFAFHLLTLIDFDWFTNPGTVPSISVEKLKNFKVVYLNVEEQTIIANFLDDKTAQIDKLIANKKNLIELLKEERTTLINEAVSGKGNNWERKKLKYVAKLRDELIDYSNFKIAVENIESASGRLINMEEEKHYDGQLSVFKKGDTIFNKLRPYLHKVYLAEKNGGLFGELLIIFSIGELIPEFLFFKLFSKNFIDVVDGSTQGTKMPRANWNDFISQLMISFPRDKTEQSQIVKYIQTETKRIDNTILKIEKEIELMNEYRTSLISEVVTGKIKVI